MIYVTVGNHDKQFDRLIKAMDLLAPKLSPMVMQIGHGKYLPKNAEWSRFYPSNRAMQLIMDADAVVAHAGVGTILTARNAGTPLVICPRRKGMREHLNDHQLEISNEILLRPKPLVSVALETNELETLLLGALKIGKAAPPKAFDEPAGGLKQTLADFLADCEKR